MLTLVPMSNNEAKISPKKASSSFSKYFDFKMMFLYPGIIFSAGWTIINIVKIIGYVDQLKSEKPECTQPNDNRHALFALTIMVVFLLKDRIEEVSIKFFLTSSIVPIGKFPIDS